MTPDRFFNDMMQLASQSPRDAADVANTWRNRYLNTGGGGGQTRGQQAGSVITGFATGLIYGGVGGFFKAEDDDIWEDWKGLSADDPQAGFRIAGLQSWKDGSPYVEGHKADPKRYPKMKPGTLYNIPYTLLSTLVLGAAAWKPWLGEHHYLLEESAKAGIVYLGVQLGDMVAYDWQMGRIEKAGQQAGQQQAA